MCLWVLVTVLILCMHYIYLYAPFCPSGHSLGARNCFGMVVYIYCDCDALTRGVYTRLV